MNPRQDLTPMLHARSVAIVGISGPERFGGLLFRNLQAMGYPGSILGVNPRYESLYDRPCYPSLGELPSRPDCALIAVPNARLEKTLVEVAECAIPAAVIFANAFSEPEEGTPSLQTRLAEIARENKIVVCGPNCMGFIAPSRQLAVSGYEVRPDTPSGNVTLISHSGSVWEAFLQNRRGLAFNYIVSSGNEMQTSVADYMQFALRDETTRAIGIFLEAVRDPETFTAALVEAAERDVPVAVLKTGRTARGAELARAHSGALAGEDAAYDAIFARHGVQRVRSIDEMMDTLELLASGARPHTSYASALLDSGGQRALLVDLAEAEGVAFTPIRESTRSRLAEVLEPNLDPINPLDAWGTGNGAEEIYAESLLALDADPDTGITLFAVDLCPAEDEQPFYPTVLDSVRERLRKPLAFLAHASATVSDAQASRLRGLGYPVLQGTETGLRATRHLLDYSAFQRERRRELSPAAGDGPRPPDPTPLREHLLAGEPLDEFASKELLRAYGLRTTRETVACSHDEALRAALAIGYPVALKTASGDLHKTERDGVRLSIEGPDALSEIYLDFEARLGSRVLVQEMVPPGTELLLGMARDPQFGPMLTLGSGGIFVEFLRDVRMLPLPTTERDVRSALASLAGAALLSGARGRPAADVDCVVRAAQGLAALVADLGDDIAEIDLNPLVALPDAAIVVDALIVPRKTP